MSEEHTSARPRVAVCVVTCRRPQGLGRLLGRLAELRFESGVVPMLELLVVDNDAARSAEAVCEAHRDRLAVPLYYHFEPRRGIAIARNTAVRLVRERCDFVAFIDDDEEPDARWLDELLRVQRAHAADVVSGPVLPRFEAPPRPWLRDGGFFERTRYATGTRPRFGATNNVLIRSEIFAGRDAPFDERLALTGGEDTLFFLELARAGCRHVWADTALVYEWLAPTRVRAAWILRREFRKGISLAFCERHLRGTAGAVRERLPRALARLAVGVARVPLFALGGRTALLRASRDVCYALGSLAGLAGFSYDEYRTIHGH